MKSTLEIANATAEEMMSPHYIESLPVLVLFPHNRCNCRCVMCDIWKIRQAREIMAQDLEPHLASMRRLGVRWVVISGGEPLLHSDLTALSRLLRNEGIRVTLLTAGLLLERYAHLIADHLDDVIVSLDGPPEVHDRIRGIPKAFERLARGVESLRTYRPAMPIQGRCTVQKANHNCLRAIVRTAQRLALNSISFLAADLTSEAFNRPQVWSRDRQAEVALETAEVKVLEGEVDALGRECAEEIRMGFVVENVEKLGRIVLHFKAQLGQAQPVAPQCNAPWVSAVIEADGTLRPCFFHPPLGNIYDRPLSDLLNAPNAINFRRTLDVASNAICRRCVCSLHLRQTDP
jgi:Fe-coproporphyrin III synthase